MEESRCRPQTDGFQCGESIEVDGAVKSVIFQCNLNDGKHLEFICREPSCGALEGGEEGVTLTDEDYTIDPNFFDQGYSMAGKTGFKVWSGSRILIESLTWPQPDSDCSKLTVLQNRITAGARIIELGAGVGLVGTYLSAVGAQVLVTDLPTLVENAIDVNLLRNKSTTRGETCPAWLEPDGYKIKNGWANSASLDWTCPLDEQLAQNQSQSVDLIVASDVIFLVEMLHSLLDIVAAIFHASAANNPSFILTFQRRDAKDGEESQAFTTVNSFFAAVKERGWSLDCLAWRPLSVNKERDDGNLAKEETEVYVFEVKP